MILRGFLIALLLVPLWLYWDLKFEREIAGLDWRLMLVCGLFGCFLVGLQASYTKAKRELKAYRDKDLLIQEGWTGAKRQALKEGAMKGYELERLAEMLGHSVASVRAALVKSGDYEVYLEKYVAAGVIKFAEWQKIQRKIGKVAPLAMVDEGTAVGQQETDDGPSSSNLVRSLARGWFDPRVEFRETFYLSAETGRPDPATQHEVVKHVAAFLNNAGGYVLIGVGRQGRLLGLFDDDFRTPLHYTQRLSETLRKSLGNASMKFIDVRTVRMGSEDVCLVTCQKSNALVLCRHQQYNKHMARSPGESLNYDRINAMTVLESRGLSETTC